MLAFTVHGVKDSEATQHEKGIRNLIFSVSGQQTAKAKELYSDDVEFDLMMWTYRAPGKYFSRASHHWEKTMERIGGKTYSDQTHTQCSV
jgi:hypothetical protein